MRIVSIFFALFLVTLISCSSNGSDGDCVDAKTLAIANPGDEFVTAVLKLVYEDESHRVYISKYLSPNGDGIRDHFGIAIFDVFDGTAYINFPALEQIDNVPSIGLVSESSYFLTQGSLRISNNCNSLFYTEDINQLQWAPHYMENTAEGIYKVNLKLTFHDSTVANINTTSEVLQSFYPKD